MNATQGCWQEHDDILQSWREIISFIVKRGFGWNIGVKSTNKVQNIVIYQSFVSSSCFSINYFTKLSKSLTFLSVDVPYPP